MHARRTLANVTGSNLGGIGALPVGRSPLTLAVATLVFRQQDAPNYLPGVIVCIGSQVLTCVRHAFYR